MPTAPELNESALLHYAHGDLITAAKQLEAALTLNPEYHEAWANRAMVLNKAQDPFDAILNYDRAIKLRPDIADYWNNRGLCYAGLGEYEKAKCDYQLAIIRRPDFAEALHNLGTASMWEKDYPHAIELYRRALAIKPLADIEMSLANALLSDGQLKEGWKAYEARFRAPRAHLRRIPLPEWRGERGRDVLVYAEQGFGDAIMFGRYARMLQKQYECCVHIEVPRPLLRLFETTRGVNGVIAYGDNVPTWIYSAVPMMSLPIWCGTDTVDDIPWPGPYFDVEPNRHLRQSIDEHAAGKFKVGLCWSSGVRTNQPELHEIATAKSMTLRHLLPLTHIDGVSLISLQKGPPAAQTNGTAVYDLTDGLWDFHDTAELIQCLDLVITVDTAVAHLAGALGKPCWIMTPYVNCYRWLGNRTDSPWYSSLTQFQQPAPNDWTAVVANVAAALKSKLRKAA